MSENKEKGDKAFFTDSFSVLFKPEQFVLDFKQSVPKISASREHEHENVVWHKPVMMNPGLAKRLSQLLQKNLEKYEEKFGEIEIGDLEEATESDDRESSGESSEDEPSYIG